MDVVKRFLLFEFDYLEYGQKPLEVPQRNVKNA